MLEFWCSVFYCVANLPLEKVCISVVCIKSNFDFKWLDVKLKINSKTCKPLNNKFPGSNWILTVMGIERSEVYDKVCVTKFCTFFTTPGAITNL